MHAQVRVKDQKGELLKIGFALKAYLLVPQTSLIEHIERTAPEIAEYQETDSGALRFHNSPDSPFFDDSVSLTLEIYPRKVQLKPKKFLRKRKLYHPFELFVSAGNLPVLSNTVDDIAAWKFGNEIRTKKPENLERRLVEEDELGEKLLDFCVKGMSYSTVNYLAFQNQEPGADRLRQR